MKEKAKRNSLKVLRTHHRKKTHTKPRLAVITTYFNPQNYTSRKNNYLKFSERIKKQCDLFPIELSVDGKFFICDERVIKIRGNRNNLLWQKERLLNLALEHIPSKYNNIAWVDCDILFKNKNWASEVNKKLETYKVVHLFEYADRLDENGNVFRRSKSLIKRIEELNRIDIDLTKAICGFGWAARRESIEKVGFLDDQIIGGADFLMCNAFLGTRVGREFEVMNKQWLKSYLRWAKKAFKEVNRSVSFISGEITHLYHGSMKNRFYNERHARIAQYNFNPETDLEISPNGLWALRDPKIKKELSRYFKERKEDERCYCD